MTRQRLGTWSLIGGCLLVLSSFVLLGSAQVGQWLYDVQTPPVEDDLAARIEAVAPQFTATPPPASLGVPAAAPSVTAPREARALTSRAPATVRGAPASTSEATSTFPRSVPTPTPTPMPQYGQPVSLAIPSINLNARVTPVGINAATREYQIDWWHVGWHDDSPMLGSPGNTVFNGHVETINAGRVFNRLRELQPGDLIHIYSDEHRTVWVVESTERVSNTEWRFVQPTEDVRATFYTCEGFFDWSTRRFSHFRVVTARLVEATDRT